MLELGENIREGITRGQKAPHAYGDRPGCEAKCARTAASLGQAGAKLWRDIHSDFEITGAGGLAMLSQICARPRVLRGLLTMREGCLVKCR